MFTVVSLNWIIIIGLFILSFLLTVVTYLLASITRKPVLVESVKEIKKVGGFEQPFEPNNYTGLTDVRNRSFTNEKVLLDGHRYTDCKFTNVKFVYNGTAYSEFTHNEIYGSYHFESENVGISVACALLGGLGYLKSHIPLLDEEQNPLKYVKPLDIKE